MPIVSLPVTASMEFPASQTQPLRRPALNGILPQLDPDPDPGLVLDTQSGPQSGRVIPKTVSRPNCRLRRYAHDSFDFMSLRRANIVPFPIIHPRSSPKPHPQTSFQPPHALLKSFPSLLLKLNIVLQQPCLPILGHQLFALAPDPNQIPHNSPLQIRRLGGRAQEE